MFLNCTSVILILGFLRRCVRVCSEDSECIENGIIFSGEDKFEVMEECGESGEGASVNAYRILRNWGCNMDRRPQAGGPY